VTGPHIHGRGVHHDWDERRKWQDPEAILGGIGLQEGDVFVDLGCGDGFFAIPAARLVGAKGKVLALDVDPEAIAGLTRHASGEGLGNIATAVGEAENTVMCLECADVVFFGIDFHDFYDQAAVLSNARKTVKPSGILIDLDWKKEEGPFGPPVPIRFDEPTASRFITDAGFEIESTSESGRYHYIIVARPKAT
jgi:ubiquinone/menaquinone biosynthesis C-methylase UbiE